MKKLPLFAAAIIALGVASSPALAVGTSARTFVSATPPGNDAGTCPTTAPCRTFAYALTQTAPSGEIIVLTSGGYGSVTIGQAVSIINTSNFAGVTVASGNGITINAGAGDSVVLRGITVDGGGVGSNGIVFNSGGTLTIDQCNVMNFSAGDGVTTGNGILMQPSIGNEQFIITSTSATKNMTGVSYLATGTASAGFVIDHVTANNNNNGFNLASGGSSGSAKASIANSIASANTNNGFGFFSFFTSLDLSYASGNQGDGVQVSHGSLFLGRSVLTANGNGLDIKGTAVSTYQDNRIAGNGTDIFGGTPLNATPH